MYHCGHTAECGLDLSGGRHQTSVSASGKCHRRSAMKFIHCTSLDKPGNNAKHIMRNT